MNFLPALFRRKAQPQPPTLSAVPSNGFFGMIRESFTGAWQRNVEVDPPKTLLTFSAVYACVTIIASDIAKMRVRLMEQDNDGVWTEIEGGATAASFKPVLRKPNPYQNRIQFITAWITSKLLWGNTYVLKVRDRRQVVVAMYVLDPSLVRVLVADNGDVWYSLSRDNLSDLREPITVPGSEIIHDRMNPLWHPLVGVSPLSACGSAATMGNKIQTHSQKFFDNMARPSGVLTAPGTIQDTTADRLKKYWEENYSAENIGRLAVLGDGLKYEAMTIPANDAQLIEQLRFTVEDVARAFHMPLYKLGVGAQPGVGNVEALNMQYYSDCLQIHIESLELCLDEGLALPDKYGTELDIEGLMRMDSASRFAVHTQAIGGGWLAPNEARKKENLKPVKGGDTPYMQQQNYALAALADRDKNNPLTAPAQPAPGTPALGVPPMPGIPEETEDEEAEAEEEMKKLLSYVAKGLSTATPRLF